MARKRDRRPPDITHDPPVALAGELVTLLDDQDDPRSHRLALWKLLTNGPAYADVSDVKQLSDAEVQNIAHALRDYLRSAVRSDFRNQAWLDFTGVRVKTERSLDDAALSSMEGPILGRASANLWLLMHLVGFRAFWECAAPDCSRIFVKRYRREFCSQRCEKRTYKRRTRQDARAQQPQKSIRTGRK